MPNVSFVQADIERLIRAAKRAGAVIKFDVRTFEATIIPDIHRAGGVDPDTISTGNPLLGNLAPDGKENWDED
ncbi:hypothetical protein JET14_13545 [Martelella lutilitoris]|uniref:Uncharacterized protein n=1 Tax=Martelella lutilitoris TaxID=2583532 RepID=A0A7T7HHK7_9HYPH|nr:hypothetical protein [Martelella lutilitoris]QQM29348.1 hypothetical protein JET14_13545 [Martelella lutilitoris]